MKNSRSPIFSLLFLFAILTTIGILATARAHQPHEPHAQGIQATAIKTDALAFESATTGKRATLSAWWSQLSVPHTETHAEPLLLLLLGTVLLSVTMGIKTGINLTRTRKPHLQGNAADPAQPKTRQAEEEKHS